MRLDDYRLLGRSGLKVSPMALGTMTFGTEWGWGTEEAEARQIFDTYIDRGGNFIDTANFYTGGTAERMVGAFAAGRRDTLVIATKYTLPMRAGDPNSGGNSRRAMVRAVEDSLRRLGTDYIDLLYLQAWDFTTPVEEILRAMDDLVAAGKVVYLGLSDIPAWQAARMQAIADLRGWFPMIALQLEYNLIERSGDRDLIPMGREMGMGVLPWSPLASGLLSGKYHRKDLEGATEVQGRAAMARQGSPMDARTFGILDVQAEIAAETGGTSAAVALAFLLSRSGVAAPIVGARTLEQLKGNLAALSLDLDPAQLSRLEDAGAPDLGFPHSYLRRPEIRQNIYGGLAIQTR